MSAAIAPLQLEVNAVAQENLERFDEKAYEDKKDERQGTNSNSNENSINSTFWKNNKIHIKNILITFLCRSTLIGYSIWITAFFVCVNRENNLYWLLTIPIFLIILDTLYICTVRKGIEFDW